jgi:multidrug efflux pump subunit AcrA (membrane-fusion protein)
VQKLVAPGQLIQAGSTTCYVISDVSNVWVQGHIFDRDLASVRPGDTVEETNPSVPVVFHGVVEYIGAMLDPATRTTPVRIVTRNQGGLLKKDMFVEAVIHTRTLRNILSAPTSSLLRNAQNEPFVYVEASPGRFAQRLVATGGQQDNLTEITSGLKEGERIVSEGSEFLQFANSTR